MSIELLLMTDVPDLGVEGDVVKVSDGYARNYLLPKKAAAPVTAATRRQLVKLQQEREKTRLAQTESARALAEKLAKASCTITVKTGGEGKLFGSVTAGDISQALKEQGIEIDRHSLLLEEPLKELGVFDVKVKLHPDVEGSVKVWVVEE